MKCEVEGCATRRKYARFCAGHQRRFREYGDPLGYHIGGRHAPDDVRFWNKVQKGDGCWIWLGAHDKPGYGNARFRGKTWRAHRVAYTLLVGPIPDGLVLDHLCRNPPCVNPAHLEPVTLAENMARGEHPSGRALRTGTCIKGHPFTDENTHFTKRGHRACKACWKNRSAA